MKTFLRRLKQEPRKPIALILFIGIAVAIVYFGFVSLSEKRVDFWLERDIRSGPIRYRLIVDSVDETKGLARVRASLIHDKINYGLIRQDLERDLGPLPDLVWQSDRIKLRYGPLTVNDLGEVFEAAGTLILIWPVKRLEKPPELPLPPDFSEIPPKEVDVELLALGNPRLFPFDRYLLIGEVYCEVLASLDGKKFSMVRRDFYEAGVRESSFVLRYATESDLRNWPTIASRVGLDRDTRLVHSRNRFQLVLERPLFLKAACIFLFLTAALSLLLVVFSEKPTRILFNATAYFLALWAVREAFSTWAPKMPTMVDYLVLGLYALLVAGTMARFLWRSVPSRSQ